MGPTCQHLLCAAAEAFAGLVNTVVTFLLHSCYNVVTLLLYCCYNAVTLLLHGQALAGVVKELTREAHYQRTNS